MKLYFIPILAAAATFAVGRYFGGKAAPAGQLPPAANISAATNINRPVAPESSLARTVAHLSRVSTLTAAQAREMLENGRVEGPDVLAVVRRWAELDASGVWQWFEDGGNSKLVGFGYDVQRTIFSAWAAKDPQSACTAALKKRIDGGSNIRGAVVQVMLDPTTPEPTRAILLQNFAALAKADITCNFTIETAKHSVANLMALPPSPARDDVAVQIMGSWVDGDWKGASSFATSQQEPLKSKLLENLVSTALNPDSRSVYNPDLEPSYKCAECFAWASEWFSKNATRATQTRLGPSYVEEIAKTDPAAALKWAQEHLASGTLAKAVSEIISRSPAQQRKLIEQLPPGGVRRMAAMEAIRYGPTQESVNWLISIEPPSPQGWSQIGSQWAFSDPTAFKNYVKDLPKEKRPSSLISSGIQNLLRKDPPGTLLWTLETQPSEFRNTYFIWKETSPKAATSWLEQNQGKLTPEQIGETKD